MKAAIQRSVAGSVRSGASTLTSSSPETPGRLLQLDSDPRPRGRSGGPARGCRSRSRSGSRAPQPISGQAPARSPRTRPGGGRSQARVRTAGGSGRRGRLPSLRRGPDRRPPARTGPSRVTEAQGREAGGQRQPECDRDADARAAGRSRGPSGSGRAARTRKPAPVARQAVPIVGPAAAGGGSGRLSPSQPRRRRPRRSGPGAGSRSRRRGRSGSAGRRSRPSSASRRPGRGGRRRAPRRPGPAPGAAAAGASGRRAGATTAMTATATARRTSRASSSAPPTPSTTTGHAGDHVAAAVEREAGRRLALPPRRPARGVVSLDRGPDQLDRPVALGVAEVGPQPDDDLRRAPVREEVGEARLRRPARAAQVEDDGGGEVGVAEARSAGDPVFAPPLRARTGAAAPAAPSATSRSSWRPIWITASLRKVAGPATYWTGRSRPARRRARGAGRRPAEPCPRGSPRAAAGGPRLSVRSSSCRSPSARTTIGSSPNVSRSSSVAR